MTRARDLLAELRRRGVVMQVDGDHIRLRPRQAGQTIDPALIETVRREKAAILDHYYTYWDDGTPIWSEEIAQERLADIFARIRQHRGINEPGNHVTDKTTDKSSDKTQMEENTMAMIVKKEKSNFIPCPQGLWPGVLVDVVDKGMLQTQYGPKHYVQLRWQIDAEPRRQDGRTYIVVQRYGWTLHEKSNLRPMLETWLGRQLTLQEVENGLDLETLLGRPCQIQVTHAPGKDGQVFARVQAVIAPSKGAVPLRPSPDYVRVCDRASQPQSQQQQQEELAVIDDSDIPF